MTQIEHRPTYSFSTLRTAMAFLFQSGIAATKVIAAPKSDLTRLSPRLLKDAGLDAGEVERIRVARSPLIR